MLKAEKKAYLFICISQINYKFEYFLKSLLRFTLKPKVRGQNSIDLGQQV